MAFHTINESNLHWHWHLMPCSPLDIIFCTLIQSCAVSRQQGIEKKTVYMVSNKGQTPLRLVWKMFCIMNRWGDPLDESCIVTMFFFRWWDQSVPTNNTELLPSFLDSFMGYRLQWMAHRSEAQNNAFDMRSRKCRSHVQAHEELIAVQREVLNWSLGY